jgi:predicted transcriptional regulator
VKVIDIKKLPILVNLDKVVDESFLSAYQRAPYILLKKSVSGDYIVCQEQDGALECEHK